jgi:hypothetical protein
LWLFALFVAPLAVVQPASSVAPISVAASHRTDRTRSPRMVTLRFSIGRTNV